MLVFCIRYAWQTGNLARMMLNAKASIAAQTRAAAQHAQSLHREEAQAEEEVLEGAGEAEA